MVKGSMHTLYYLCSLRLIRRGARSRLEEEQCYDLRRLESGMFELRQRGVLYGVNWEKESVETGYSILISLLTSRDNNRSVIYAQSLLVSCTCMVVWPIDAGLVARNW